MKTAIPIPMEAITTFCEKWGIVRFELFGSVLRDDFDEKSDVDTLVTFDDRTEWSLFDLACMKVELEALFGRNVDIVERAAIINPYRRLSIFRTAQTIYARAS
ncbi:nucleotidyltransferase domain-containing protein [soil metagenome]